MKEYSNDSGKTWEGPFTDSEISSLTACGIINANTLVRTCGAGENPAANEAVPQVSVPVPPPTTEVAEVYYTALPGGKPQGPFPIEQIRQQLSSGALSPSAQAWKQGWPGWIPVMDLFAVPEDAQQDQAHDIGDIIADVVGTRRVRSFRIKDFFSEVFKTHQPREMEAFFCSGGPQSTPVLHDAPMPKPWIYTRVLGFFIVLLVSFVILAQYSETMGALCLIVTLNFAVPFSMLVLFAEVNVARDVSWFKILQMFFMGGICSLLFTFLIGTQTGAYAPYWAGPVEETAKLAACLLVAGARIRKGGILQGLLCGAAVGAGFAIPESIQYFFQAMFWHESQLVELVQQGQVQISQAEANEIICGAAFSNSCLRAVLSPFAHVLYTPIVAAAAWRLLREREFSFGLFLDFRFLRLALVGVLLHAFWNSPLFGDSMSLKLAIVVVVGWSAIFLLIHEGLAGIRSASAPRNGNP